MKQCLLVRFNDSTIPALISKRSFLHQTFPSTTQSLFSPLRAHLLDSGSAGDLGVKHEDHGGSDGTESVGSGSLEESGGSLLLHDLGEAVGGSLVDPLLLGLLGLHLKAPTDGVEGVGSVSGGDGGGLGAEELGEGTHDTVVALLVRVVSGEGVEESEVDSTVRDDTDDGDSDSVVEGSDSSGGHGLLEAVGKAAELLLSGSDIGSETGTGVIEGVDDHEGSGSGKSSTGDVGHEELQELSVLVSLGELGLDGVLEGEVEGLGREVPDDVGGVSTPEGLNSLLSGDTGEAVDDASVPLDLSGDNLRVGILGLDEKLDTLNGSSAGLGDGSGDTASEEGDHEIRHIWIFVLSEGRGRDGGG